MQFIMGAIPNSPDFQPDESWKTLREPGPWSMRLVTIPIGLAVSILIAVCWLMLTPLGGSSVSFSPLGFLLVPVGLVPAHAFVRLLLHPRQGRSSRSIFGFWPSKLLFYAHYEGELSRLRFTVMLIMPFIAVSLFPLFLASAFHITSFWAACVSTFSALISSSNIFGAAMVLFQVPSGATIRNQAWMTYWRIPLSVQIGIAEQES